MGESLLSIKAEWSRGEQEGTGKPQHQESHQSGHEVVDDGDRQGRKEEGTTWKVGSHAHPTLDGTSSHEPSSLQVQVSALDPGQLCVRTPAGVSL